jgi:serine/threonine protein kinase
VSEGSPTEEFGPYLVYEQLGVGGMAQVHRAIVKTSDVRRPVALKRMLSHIASSEEMVKSFVREARLASYLRHQNVAQTYDLGRVGEVYFIVMELITGRNLREVLKHCGRTTGPMPVRIALNILNQICDALDYAHNLRDDTGEPLGIIHRDVSPSNVIVSESGVVKLIDFGIAKVSGAGMQTMSGTLKGKFAYMAPEYIEGKIDARADLFAIGVIAHELLTNRPLFSGRDDIDTLTRVRDMNIAPPSSKNPLVPPEIDDIVMTALARDPDRRWQHATALRTALTTLTRRLDLIATNTQVVEWLDWAFTQAARGPRHGERPDNDTETDAPSLGDDPSISIEECTVQLLAMSQKMTMVRQGSDPSPPIKTPSGTPAYVPAQRSSSPPPIAPAPGASPAVTVRGSALGPRGTLGPATAPAARSSSTIPIRQAPSTSTPSSTSPTPKTSPASPRPSTSSSSPRASTAPPPSTSPATSPPPSTAPPSRSPTSPRPSTAPPPAAMPNLLSPQAGRPNSTVLGTSAPPARAGRSSSAPPLPPGTAPMSAALAAHLNAAQALGTLDARSGLAPAPAPAAEPVRGARPAPGFAGPGNAAAPAGVAPIAAPRPPAPIPSSGPLDAARLAPSPHGPAPHAQVPSTAAAPPARRSRMLAVVLVVLAAAIAAITVYFVLPLLT